MDVTTALLHLKEKESLVPNDTPRKKSGKQKRAEVVKELRAGRSPLEILESMTEWSPPVFWGVVDYLRADHRMHEALKVNHYCFTCVEERDLCSIVLEI